MEENPYKAPEGEQLEQKPESHRFMLADALAILGVVFAILAVLAAIFG